MLLGISCADRQDREAFVIAGSTLNSGNRNSDDLTAAEAPEENPDEVEAGDVEAAEVEAAGTVEELLTACEQGILDGTLLTDKKVLLFDANAGEKNQCQWLADKKNEKIRGYRPDPKALAIPTSRVVCSLALKSEKEFKYDDAVMLTFNDHALLWANLNPSVLDKDGTAYVFDKKKIQESEIKGEPGCMEGFDACKAPGQEMKGDLALSFTDEANKKFTTEIEMAGAVFNLITFGDDNKEIDCTHNGLELEVNYLYYEKAK